MKQPRIIMTTWLNHSWKSTFAQQLKEANEKIVVVENDQWRLFAQEQYPKMYKETEKNNRTDFDNPSMKLYHMKSMCEFGVINWYTVVCANCHTKKWFREKCIEYFHWLGAKVILVYMDIPYEILVERAHHAHQNKDESIYSNIKTWKGWFMENLQWMKESYEIPSSLEADRFFHITDNSHHEEVIEEILKIIE